MSEASALSGRRDLQPQRSNQRALRLALLALEIAAAGEDGLTRDGLWAIPGVEHLYSERQGARYAAFRRDLETLTGEGFRAAQDDASAEEAPVKTTTEAVSIAPIVLDPMRGRYRLRRSPPPALRLSARAREALQALERGVAGGEALPGGRELFHAIHAALGEGTAPFQAVVPDHDVVEKPTREQGSPFIRLEFGLREGMGALERVIDLFTHAWRERRTLEFSYRANGGLTAHFGDQPLDMWLADHAYASVWCEEANRPIDLRLDRVVPETLRFSPRMGVTERRIRGIRIRYRLSRVMAHGEVTERLEGQTVEWLEDGDAIVSGVARNLFWARQLLLKYGSHAQALEPQTLVAQMRHEAERMRAMYADEKEAHSGDHTDT